MLSRVGLVTDATSWCGFLGSKGPVAGSKDQWQGSLRLRAIIVTQTGH